MSRQMTAQKAKRNLKLDAKRQEAFSAKLFRILLPPSA